LKNKVFYSAGCEKRDEIRLFGGTEKRSAAQVVFLLAGPAAVPGNRVCGYNFERLI
jgi:hypothetical protein